MGRKGRPQKTGPRKGNRPAPSATARDYGNIKVMERHNRFRHFIDDKGLVFEGTSAGRLWIVGGLDGYDLDPQVLRDCLLEYGDAYWCYYPSTAAVANYAQENRRGYAGGDHTDPDPRGDWFTRMDNLLRGAGRVARQAVHNVTVDTHWFPDDDCDWVQRIINSRVLSKRVTFGAGRAPDDLTICGEIATSDDWGKLQSLCLGALALARGTNRSDRRAA